MLLISQGLLRTVARTAYQAGYDAYVKAWTSPSRADLYQLALAHLAASADIAPLKEREPVKLVWQVNFYWGFRRSEAIGFDEPDIDLARLHEYL